MIKFIKKLYKKIRFNVDDIEANPFTQIL